MRRIRSHVLGETVRRAVSIGLAVLFTGGLASEAYAWHDCPRHHPETEASGDAVLELSAHATWSSADDDASRPSEHRCSCVGSCHAGAATPLPGLAPAPRQPAHVAVAMAAAAPDASILPRRVPYLLPLPNAPPVL